MAPHKIYTKIRMDMATGELLEEEYFNYSGPLALCEGGEAPPEWHSTLPEDVRQWDEVKNSDSPEKFWDQMVNMRSRMGSSIRIPSADAGDEDRAAFHAKLKERVPGLMSTPNFEDESTLNDLYTRMGRPGKAGDYVTPKFVNSKGEELKDFGKEFVKSYKEVAFKAGLSQKKFEESLNAMMSRHITATEQAGTLHKEDRAKLEAEWGTAFDRNTNIVKNFITQSEAPESVVKAVEAGSVDRSTMVWLHRLATKTLGASNSFQQDTSNSGVMTPAEATIKISEIRNNKKHPYNNPHDPGHKTAMAFMRELYLLKNPKTGTQAAPGTTFPIGSNDK